VLFNLNFRSILKLF